MNTYIAMIVYKCYRDGVYAGEIDLAVKCFCAESKEDVELMIMAEGNCAYDGAEGNRVEWRLRSIEAIEEWPHVSHGEEIIGIIRPHDFLEDYFD